MPPNPIQASTQEHLDIEDIIDNLIILKDGSAAMIITTTAVNFGLLSEAEQDATIYAYAALLNSLTFPIQIVIRSNRKDITGYEKLLSEQEARTPKTENKERIRKYREFIQETVRQRNVLDKKFYIIIPFSVLELGVAKSAAAIARGPRHALPFPKDYIVTRAKVALEPKRDHLLHQLTRLGLRARQLTTKELIQLMFEIYNPESAQGQILAAPEEYQTPLVRPAIAFQELPQIEPPPAQQEKPPFPAPPLPPLSQQPGNQPQIPKEKPGFPQTSPVPAMSQVVQPAPPPAVPTSDTNLDKQAQSAIDSAVTGTNLREEP